MPEERLQKVLAAAGVASRRACEGFIIEGRVTVNGEVAELGSKVDRTRDVVAIDGERVNVDPDRVYVMLNKPQGVVTTADDPEGRPTVVDLINLPQRLFPIGRLDMDTEGLLLLSNDGELTNALLHPSREVERWYVALLTGPVKPRALTALREGVELEDGLAKPKRFKVLEEGKGKALLEIVMTEGRKREVRRMLAEIGLPVERLARVRFGDVELGELRQGKWRFLTQAEIGALHDAARAGQTRAARTSSEREARRTTREERGNRRRAGEAQPKGRRAGGGGGRR
ncbi:pseudouridine synthase [Nitriliruptor alkaliphilus]|uniref:pseudouridine synthase n=1 Tax=Nitriliruptor alkaliphilus TaxID=427918 RepID=UPI000AD93F0A|nr:pseudouridine synthase [Nitriliruptor alkaliphilus]